MPIDALYAAASALDAFSTAQAVTANNIANVNTDGFDPSRTVLEDRPDRGGTAVQDISAPEAQGPLVPGSGPGPDGFVEGSATDLVVETVALIENQRGFEANAVVVRTQDEMLGALLDEKV